MTQDVNYVENLSLSLIDDTDELYQPRLDYDEAEIKSLADDIKKCGQRNPIGVEPKGDKYRLIYGFQRVKALKLLDAQTTRANIYLNLTEDAAHFHSLSDNLQHGDLSDLEKAFRCKYLHDKGHSIETLCEVFNVKKSVIYNYLQVAELDPSTNACLHMGLITLNHAVELARLDVSKRLENLSRVLSWSMSVRDLKNWLKGGESPILYLPITSWIDLCPKHLRFISVEKVDVEAVNKKGRAFKNPPIDGINCVSCPYFVNKFEIETPQGNFKKLLCSFQNTDEYLHYPDGLKTLLNRDTQPRLDAIKELEALEEKIKTSIKGGASL